MWVSLLKSGDPLGKQPGTADKAIAVEDSPTGIASAKAAGLKVLALKPRHGEPLDQSAADCIITKLMDVKEHLD